MTKAATAPEDWRKAVALAEWSKLDDVRFGDCYVTVRTSNAAEWEMVAGSAKGALKLCACKEAQKIGFLDELAHAVANWERRYRRPAVEITAMLDEVCSYGVMQGMTDQQKGFMDPDILFPLQQVRNACALVINKVSEARLGSAFLVRDDLILTAAHIVMDVDVVDDVKQWAPRLRDGLAFRFRARDGQPKHNMVEILPASHQPLVSFALPHGKPPRQLDLAMNATGGTRLDFALVRLAQRVGHVSPVDIVETATVTKGKACWAFGFPGGNALAMDVNVVTDIHEIAGRWMHRANAAGGMSGGCCVNHEGLVAGLHEGSLDLVAEDRTSCRNRGVSIAAIRAAQKRSGKDPLKFSIGTPGVEFQNPQVVADFYHSGLRLAGDEHLDAWRVQVGVALGNIDPDSTSPLPSFHPWFPRKTVEAWIKETDPVARLCLVHGEPGVGKSFCTRMLGELLDPRTDDLLQFSPTQVNAWDWRDAISQVLVTEGSDYRTKAAAVRYRDFGDVISELRRRILDARRRCYIVIDVGPLTGRARFPGTDWFEFVAALVAVEAIRVMLIGLDGDERDEVNDRLASRPETENVTCQELPLLHLTKSEFRAYLRSLESARGWPEQSAERESVVEGVFRTDVPVPDAMRTVTAALAAIKYEAAKR